MIQDLHSHTYYSFCGRDTPDQLVETAISGGIELLGITDHNYGIAVQRSSSAHIDEGVRVNDYNFCLRRYFDHISAISEKYSGKIKVIPGIEIATVKTFGDGVLFLPDGVDISYFPYCLVEHLDSPDSVTNGDIFAYAERCSCALTGIAHTDLLSFIKKKGVDPADWFGRMAQKNIFWEMNVNYDSIHGYREHSYVDEFFRDEKMIEIVRKSEARISIGFDGHRREDYLPERVKKYNNLLDERGIKKPFCDYT